MAATGAQVLTPALLLSLSIVAITPPADGSAAEPAVSAPPVVTVPAPEVTPRRLSFVGGVQRYRFRERDGVPEGFRLVSGPSWSLFAGGAGALVGGYLVSVALAMFHQSPLAAIPVAGPLIQLVMDWSSFRWATGSLSGFVNAFVGIGMVFYSVVALVAAAAPVVGPIMMWRAFASPDRWLEKDKPAVRVSVMPGTAAGPLGASLVGQF